MNLVNEGVLPPNELDDRDERREEREMAKEREGIADIVAMLRANVRGERFDELSFTSLSDRIEEAWKRERESLMLGPRSWEECIERFKKAREIHDDLY